MENKNKLFLIAIGGTGMRCLEAFTHICAMGMLDNKDVNILTIDTDSNNGNKSKTEQLIEKYMRIKGGAQNSVTTQNTFFGAKLNLFRFVPEYSGEELTYKFITKLSKGTTKQQRDNKALSDLFFDDDVQSFRLDHGYRAQTHLGSFLMYHNILDAVRKYNANQARREDEQLADFINKIYEAGDEARVFILGSLFGGTGASSIPVIPKALADALMLKDETLKISQEAKFGCTLLSNYFTFNPPKEEQIGKERVIADSNKFSLNSQAALMFYEDDTTVRRIYNRMYHIGWPLNMIDYDQQNKKKETTTGGAEQKNPAHVVELICACAAYDFFTEDPLKLVGHEMLYKSVEFRDNLVQFKFQDFFKGDDYKKFMAKSGAFFAFSYLILAEDGNIENLSSSLAKKYNIPDYDNLNKDEAKEVNEYLKLFGLEVINSQLIHGWIYQIQNSTANPLFLFNPKAFPYQIKDLKEFNWGMVFNDEKYQFVKKKLFNYEDEYEKFREAFKEKSCYPQEDQRVKSVSERFLAHIHNTFISLHKVV